MTTAKVKASELVGAALDWAVAKSEGHQPLLMPIGRVEYAIGVTVVDSSGKVSGFACRYSSEWAQGGPLIDKYDIYFDRYPGDRPGYVIARMGAGFDPRNSGQNPASPSRLIAAMRTIVDYKIGDTVEIPAELLEVAQ